MTTIRKPARAGQFYSSNSDELSQTVQTYLQDAEYTETIPKAIIAPHAGYVYSGPIAGSAYHGLEQVRDVVRRVILFGPAHFVPFHGLASSTADQFATPLGNVPVDRETVERILELPQVRYLDEAHAQEHSLEVHLPFLQTVLADFRIVPLVVGHCSPELVAEVMLRVWNGPETLIVVSSDLSHYHDYRTARKMDEATSQSIERLAPEDIDQEHACGRLAINGLLLAARDKGLTAKTIDLRSSGDTAGPRNEVVGYGAYVFCDQSLPPHEPSA